jgi:2-keto-4-pentenoate hydratase
MTRSFDPNPAAEALHQTRLRRGMVGRLPASIAPETEAEGTAAQLALARRVGAVPPAGFKIGATGKRMQEYLGLTGPTAGFVAEATVLASGARLAFSDFVRPGVECELAVRLGQDLPADPCTQAQALAAVADLMAGIEVVDNRYGAIETVHMPTAVADQFFHAAAILGAPAAPGWQSLDLPDLEGRISVNGQERDRGRAAELLGHPLQCLAWLAASPLAHAFGGLRAGQIVMLGSVTPPVWLDGPAEVTVAFTGLAPVSVTLG